MLHTLTYFREQYPFFVGDKLAFVHAPFEDAGEDDSEWSEWYVIDKRLEFKFKKMENNEDTHYELSLATVYFINDKVMILSQLFRNDSKNTISTILVSIRWDHVKQLVEADRLMKID